jgi:hypothetical protein
VAHRGDSGEVEGGEGRERNGDDAGQHRTRTWFRAARALRSLRFIVAFRARQSQGVADARWVWISSGPVPASLRRR